MGICVCLQIILPTGLQNGRQRQNVDGIVRVLCVPRWHSRSLWTRVLRQFFGTYVLRLFLLVRNSLTPEWVVVHTSNTRSTAFTVYFCFCDTKRVKLNQGARGRDETNTGPSPELRSLELVRSNYLFRTGLTSMSRTHRLPLFVSLPAFLM